MVRPYPHLLAPALLREVPHRIARDEQRAPACRWGPYRSPLPTALHLLNVSGLRTLLPLNDLEFDLLALGQRLEAAATDRAEVTNTSGPPSREMKPKPFASLNHFTVPVMRDMVLSFSKIGYCWRKCLTPVPDRRSEISARRGGVDERLSDLNRAYAETRMARPAGRSSSRRASGGAARCSVRRGRTPRTAA